MEGHYRMMSSTIVGGADLGCLSAGIMAVMVLAGCLAGARKSMPVHNRDAPTHAVRQVYKRVDGRDLALVRAEPVHLAP